jgi:hypothetical protein
MKPKRIAPGYYRYPNGIEIEFRHKDDWQGVSPGWYVLWPMRGGGQQPIDFEKRTLNEAIQGVNETLEQIVSDPEFASQFNFEEKEDNKAF